MDRALILETTFLIDFERDDSISLISEPQRPSVVSRNLLRFCGSVIEEVADSV